MLMQAAEKKITELQSKVTEQAAKGQQAVGDVRAAHDAAVKVRDVALARLHIRRCRGVAM